MPLCLKHPCNLEEVTVVLHGLHYLHKTLSCKCGNSNQDKEKISCPIQGEEVVSHSFIQEVNKQGFISLQCIYEVRNLASIWLTNKAYLMPAKFTQEY